MKFKYEFEYVEIGDERVAVPIGNENFNGVVRLNETGEMFLKALEKSSTPEEALEIIANDYPDEDREEIKNDLVGFVDALVNEGLLVL